MQKKGQLTIFIIIAIFIVGGVLVFYSFRSGIILNIFSPEVGRVNSFVKDCIEEESYNIIYQIGLGGGYFLPPNLSTDSGVPIYYSEGKNHMPSKNEVEKEISIALDENLFFCIKNFIDFLDLEIIHDDVETKTEISDNKVIINVNYPISITKDESTSTIKDFKTEIPIRLGILYDSVAEFLNQQGDNENICLSCLFEISKNSDLLVNMIDYDETTILFMFRDEHSKIKNQTLVWIFANEYN